MPEIVWDQETDRTYEAGLDRGVLFLPDGTGVPWNGLTSVVEKNSKTVSSVYFDGMKIQDPVSVGDFTATMKAVTYPEEFVDIEGSGDLRSGIKLQDQPPQVFALCYRTSIGDNMEGDINAYKIHILYNITAVPSDKTFATVSKDPSLTEFEWTLYAIPEETAGFRPTGHLVIDSRTTDPLLLSDLEKQLYGTQAADATLMTMPDLVSFMKNWYRIKITDNGDGTWSADINDELVNELLLWLDGIAMGTFQLSGANAIFSTDETQYTLSDTLDASDIAEIKIQYNDDGSWTATADSPSLIILPGDGTFQILNAQAIFLDDETYRISDTTYGS